MLNQVLNEIENARGPITIHELGHKLEINPAALEGMLEFWVRKGRIQNDEQAASCESGISSCGSSCSGTSNCTFIAKMPKTYSIPSSDIDQIQRDLP
jgi:hypothetical protein